MARKIKVARLLSNGEQQKYATLLGASLFHPLTIDNPTLNDYGIRSSFDVKIMEQFDA